MLFSAAAKIAFRYISHTFCTTKCYSNSTFFLCSYVCSYFSSTLLSRSLSLFLPLFIASSFGLFICTYPIFIALAREPLHTSARERELFISLYQRCVGGGDSSSSSNTAKDVRLRWNENIQGGTIAKQRAWPTSRVAKHLWERTKRQEREKNTHAQKFVQVFSSFLYELLSSIQPIQLYICDVHMHTMISKKESACWTKNTKKNVVSEMKTQHKIGSYNIRNRFVPHTELDLVHELMLLHRFVS